MFTQNFYGREKQRKQTNKYQIKIARPKQPPTTYILLIEETNYGKYRKKYSRTMVRPSFGSAIFAGFFKMFG